MSVSSFTKSTESGISHPSSVKLISLSSVGTSQHSGDERRVSQEGKDVGREKKEPLVDEYGNKYTFLNTTYPKPTLEEYQREQLKDGPLFADILTIDDDTDAVYMNKTAIDKSILVTGFGIRNLQSLQDALQADEEKRLLELYKYRKEDSQITLSSSSSSKTTSKSTETETELPSLKSNMSAQKQKLEYLLGLETAEEEEEEYIEATRPQEEHDDQFIFSASVSMKTAQKYLRTHRIFDFFQFIIAHLLSALPENPIAFILVLLSKCLMYRSGMGNPPLLYEEKHIEELYGLMDRMKTGYIELDQYRKGMVTLGICVYNKNPPVSQDGMVAKNFFIQEALDNETALFEDLIKRKWTTKKPPSEPKYLDAGSSQSLTGPYFIPSDLLRCYKKAGDNLSRIDEEGAERGGSGK